MVCRLFVITCKTSSTNNQTHPVVKVESLSFYKYFSCSARVYTEFDNWQQTRHKDTLMCFHIYWDNWMFISLYSSSCPHGVRDKVAVTFSFGNQIILMRLRVDVYFKGNMKSWRILASPELRLELKFSACFFHIQLEAKLNSKSYTFRTKIVEIFEGVFLQFLLICWVSIEKILLVICAAIIMSRIICKFIMIYL